MNQTHTGPGYDSIGAIYLSVGISPIFAKINWKEVGINNLTSVAIQL
jgi:hypothetical protein